MRALMSPERRDEEGAVAITVALSLIVLLGSAALAVDLGYVWSQRRNMITATDASALAAAAEYAHGGVGCSATAEDYLGRNHDTAQLVACTPSIDGVSGYVTVNSTTNVNYFFARVLGETSGNVDSSSSAKWGIPYAVTGLRPFGLCAGLPDGVGAVGWLEELFDWLDDPTTAQVIRVPYGKDDNPEACNDGDDVPGNWGMIDFNGGANSNNETKDWVENGYKGLVNAGTIGQTCATEDFACYEGDPGAFSNSLGSALNSLIPDEEFAIPLFDWVNDLSGANVEFHLIAFAKVKLVDFKANGSADSRWLEFEFLPGLIEGECCVVDPAIDTGIRSTALCAVDPDDLSQCQP